MFVHFGEGMDDDGTQMPQIPRYNSQPYIKWKSECLSYLSSPTTSTPFIETALQMALQPPDIYHTMQRVFAMYEEGSLMGQSTKNKRGTEGLKKALQGKFSAKLNHFKMFQGLKDVDKLTILKALEEKNISMAEATKKIKDLKALLPIQRLFVVEFCKEARLSEPPEYSLIEPQFLNHQAQQVTLYVAPVSGYAAVVPTRKYSLVNIHCPINWTAAEVTTIIKQLPQVNSSSNFLVHVTGLPRNSLQEIEEKVRPGKKPKLLTLAMTVKKQGKFGPAYSRVCLLVEFGSDTSEHSSKFMGNQNEDVFICQRYSNLDGDQFEGNGTDWLAHMLKFLIPKKSIVLDFNSFHGEFIMHATRAGHAVLGVCMSVRQQEVIARALNEFDDTEIPLSQLFSEGDLASSENSELDEPPPPKKSKRSVGRTTRSSQVRSTT